MQVGTTTGAGREDCCHYTTRMVTDIRVVWGPETRGGQGAHGAEGSARAAALQPCTSLDCIASLPSKNVDLWNKVPCLNVGSCNPQWRCIPNLPRRILNMILLALSLLNTLTLMDICAKNELLAVPESSGERCDSARVCLPDET